jgi:hypothetical protein
VAVAEERVDDGSVAVEAATPSPRAIARYLGGLKPILAHGSDARTSWVRLLGEVSRREDQTNAFAEAQQLAIGQRQHLDEARRTLNQLAVPAGLEDMHKTLDKWLRAVIESCDVVVKSQPPLSTDVVAQARQHVYEAGVEADRFNRQRTALVQHLADLPSEDKPRPRMIANPKEMRALGIAMVIALALTGGTLYGLMQITAAALAPPAGGAAKPAAVAPPAVPEKRVFPQAEVLSRLRQEIGSRRVSFSDADVQLVQPDGIVVRGRIQGPTSIIPVEAELQMSVTADGKPRLTTKRLSAVGVSVPPEAVDALNKRVEEANKTLPEQVPAGQTLKRLYVENNAVVAELEAPGVAPGRPPPKPGA